MNFIIIDLEFNQAYDFEDGNKTEVNQWCPFEIIQIGAVKMNEKFEIIGAADFLVKPTLYLRLHPYVEKITGIKMDMLVNQVFFPEAFERFIEFTEEDYVFCTWGNTDLKALYRNVVFHSLNADKLSNKYVNIQALASDKLNNPKGMNIGLRNAVESFNIETDLSFHSAINDAIYTAKIFQLLAESPLVIKTLKYGQFDFKNQKQMLLDTLNLYKAVEKEFGRKLTKKEQQVVRKVYFMGRLKKFDTCVKSKGTINI